MSDLKLKKDEMVYLKLWISDQKLVPLIGTIRYCLERIVNKQYAYFHGVEFHQNKYLHEIIQFLKTKRAELDLIEMTLGQIVSYSDFPGLT